MQSQLRCHDWPADKDYVPHLAVKGSPSATAIDLADREQKWPPGWRVLLAVSVSAGLWTLILLSLFVAGVLRFLP